MANGPDYVFFLAPASTLLQAVDAYSLPTPPVSKRTHLQRIFIEEELVDRSHTYTHLSRGGATHKWTDCGAYKLTSPPSPANSDCPDHNTGSAVRLHWGAVR